MSIGDFMPYLYYKFPTKNINGKTYEVIQVDSHVLLQRRKELKMTQQQVADESGIQLRQYQRFENGERNLSSASGKIMLSVCETLKLDPYLFLGKGNEQPEIKYIVLPSIESNGMKCTIPSLAYYNIVSSIPRGMVCVDDELNSCLKQAYGSDSLKIDNSNKNDVKLYGYNRFPFWRVVSQCGYLLDNKYCSKERQRELLLNDGVKTTQEYRVENFKYHRFDVKNLQITILKTSDQILKEYKKYL